MRRISSYPTRRAKPGASTTTLLAALSCWCSTEGEWWPYCNGQLASYARNWERFVQEGVSLVGISVDPIENNQVMVEKLLLPFPLLSDPEGRVITEWSAWNENEAIAKPAIFAIRKNGSIAWAYVGRDFADRPTDDELFRAIREGD